MQKTPEWVILLIISKIIKENTSTRTNPTGVMKDEEKKREKQGEIGEDNRYWNYERHVDLTGWSEFVWYLDRIGVMSPMHRLFGGIRKSRKGRAVEEIFKQVLCNFVDGTSRHLVHFDRLKDDAGYAGAIESRVRSWCHPMV